MVAKKLKRAGLKFAQVSLDGLKDTHEKIRGKETFEMALRGIKSLVKAGIPVTVMVTLMRSNYKEVEGIVRLCEELGVSRVAFQRLVPIGSGKEIMDEMLSPKEVAEVLLKLHRMKSKVEIVKRALLGGFCAEESAAALLEILDLQSLPMEQYCPVKGYRFQSGMQRKTGS